VGLLKKNSHSEEATASRGKNKKLLPPFLRREERLLQDAEKKTLLSPLGRSLKWRKYEIEHRGEVSPKGKKISWGKGNGGNSKKTRKLYRRAKPHFRGQDATE